MTVFRVIPGRIDEERSGVSITPFLIMKMFSPEPSAIWPVSERRMASSYPARSASITASIELR